MGKIEGGIENGRKNTKQDTDIRKSTVVSKINKCDERH